MSCVWWVGVCSDWAKRGSGLLSDETGRGLERGDGGGLVCGSVYLHSKCLLGFSHRKTIIQECHAKHKEEEDRDSGGVRAAI